MCESFCLCVCVCDSARVSRLVCETNSYDDAFGRGDNFIMCAMNRLLAENVSEMRVLVDVSIGK